MSRAVGGNSKWGTATWGAPLGDAGVFGDTWNGPQDFADDLADRLFDDPATTEGVALAGATGGLRFVVQVLNPTVVTDSIWGTSLWGSGTWSSAAGTWEDFSERVRGVSWAQGADQPGQHASVGTAVLTCDNQDGALSPWATSGHYSNGASSWLRAGLIVRFGVLALASSVLQPFEPFFTGRVETVEEDTEQNVDGWVTLTVAELSSDLAVVPGVQQMLSGETVTQSMLRAILDSGETFQNFVTVPMEDALVTTTTLEDKSTLERLQLLADTLHWDVRSTGRGPVGAVRRGVAAGSTGYVVSNNPAPGELPFVKPKPYSSPDRVINQAVGTAIFGATQEVIDQASVAQFGPLTSNYGFPRDDLPLKHDTAVLALLQRVVGLHASDDVGIAAVEIDCDQEWERWPEALAYLAAHGLEGMGFSIRWEHPSGAIFTEDVVVEGHKHGITMEGGRPKWTATLNVGKAGSVVA